MTQYQIEQLYALVNSPGWLAYLAYKQERMERLHKDLEWEDANIKKIQGQINEIRTDLELHKTIQTKLDTLTE